MNRGVVESSPVQQMMGNPNWWNMRGSAAAPPPPPPPPLFSSTATTPPPSSNFLNPYPYAPLPFPHNQHLPPPDSTWSHLLFMGGVAGEEEEEEEEEKKCGRWEVSDQGCLVDVKQENSYVYGHGHSPASASASASASAWSPNSCVTTNMLDFSAHPQPDPSSECNSNSNSAGGGALKKARVQPSTTQSSSTFKVRKEKLGDRITALHQLVSPFGKTDTASVLLEAIGYIRFLQSQIEALSLPYLTSVPTNTRHPHPVQGEKNCIFPEDPGQLLNENCLKRKATSEQDCQEEPKTDLRSRGLCLVPVSCTLQVGSENGADYWAPALGAGFR